MADYEGQDFDALMAQHGPDASDDTTAQPAATTSYEGQDFDQLQAKYAGQDFDQLAQQYGGQDQQQPQPDQQQPQAESFVPRVLRKAAHSVLPAAGAYAGAGAGAEAGAALGSAVFPGVGTAVGGLVGGLGGALIGGYAGAKVDRAGADTLGIDDSAILAANEQAHPYEQFATGLAVGMAGMGGAAANGAARIIGGGIQGAAEAGQEYVNEGKFDPAKIAMSAVAGAARPGLNKLGETVEDAGRGAVGRFTGRSTPEGAPVTSDEPATVAPDRSERAYGKDTAPTSPQEDMLTSGDMDPATAAALKEANPEPAPEPAPPPQPIEPVEPAPPSFDEMPAQPQEPVEQPTIRAAENPPEKVTGEVGEFGGGKEPPEEPPQEAKEEPEKETLSAPPSKMAEVTKEDLATGIWPALKRIFGGMSGPSFKAAQKNILGKQGWAERLRQRSAARFTDDDRPWYAQDSMSRDVNALGREDKTGSHGEGIDSLGSVGAGLDNLLNKTKPAEGRMFMNYVQGGNRFPHYQPSENLKTIVQPLRDLAKDFQDSFQSMNEFEKMHFFDNYITGQYKNKEAADNYFREFTRTGGSGSTKKRRFPTDEEARDAGLEPITTNPIDRMLLYADTTSKFLAWRKELQEGKDTGHIKYFSPEAVGGAGSPDPYVKGHPPEGWTPIIGLKNKAGVQAYAPRNYATAMNNMHGAGIATSEIGKTIVDALRRSSNMYTAWELGVALYHGFTTVHERTGSNWSVALSKMMDGDMTGAGKTFANGLTAPADPFMKNGIGKRFQDIYSGKAKDVTPQEAVIADAMEKANFKPIGAKQHAMDYDMSKAGSFYTSYVRGSLKAEIMTDWKAIIGENGWKWNEALGVLPRNLGRAMQTIAQPLFEAYIPRMKTAAFVENVQAWIEKNPNHTLDELHDKAIAIGKSIDNRMGEMAHDNMLMNKSLRDVASIMMRSFSFTAGPFREIGGGAQSLVRGALKGQNRAALSSKFYDPRTAYALAFPIAVASMSTIYQFMKTGEAPSELKDLVYPRTGGQQPGMGGKGLVPERALLPGYHKDLVAYFKHPQREAKNKLAGLWQAIWDQFQGKQMSDVGEVPIVRPHATLGEEAIDRAKAFGSRAMPIIAKSAMQTPRKTSHISYPEQVIGVRSPGTFIADPDYEKKADKYAERDWKSAQNKQNRDRASRGLPPIHQPNLNQ